MALSKILLAYFPYESVAPERIRALGRRVLRDPTTAPRRANVARDLAYYAGRAAVGAALARLSRQAWVEADRRFGYLRAVDQEGNRLSDLYVNISHTQQIAVAAVCSMSSVGADIESVTRNASRVIQRVGTPREISAWKGKLFPMEGASLAGELVLWSGKEAVSKAVGLGIKFGMHHFEIHLEPGGRAPHPVRLGLRGPLPLERPAIRFCLIERFFVAVCASELALAEPPELLPVIER